MKNVVKISSLMSLAVLGIGMMVAGCKSAPPLTQDQALSMIQAHYDALAPSGFDVNVNNSGMISGATAKLWQRTLIYPNKYWADFKLTDTGKKYLKIPSGGEVIQWRPNGPTDTGFSYVLTTTVLKHRKAKDIHDIQDVGSKVKTVSFSESVDLTDLPPAIVDIAHNPGNQLSTTRTAEFDLDANGTWTLKSVQ